MLQLLATTKNAETGVLDMVPWKLGGRVQPPENRHYQFEASKHTKNTAGLATQIQPRQRPCLVEPCPTL